MMALSGILMALFARQATGKGRFVDVSMTDGAMAMLSIHAVAVLAGMPAPERGNMILTGMFPCYETYRCACGGYVSVRSLSEGWFWKNLVTALGREDLIGLQYATGREHFRAWLPRDGGPGDRRDLPRDRALPASESPIEGSPND